MVKQRNARLADALGIKSDAETGVRGNEVEWTAEQRGFAASNAAWVRVVEGTLGEFFRGGKQSVILPQSEWSRVCVYQTVTLR
jgi:transcriptional repressor NF-X1